MLRLRLFFLVAWTAVTTAAAAQPCVATLGGHEVAAREWRLFVAKDRAQVAREAFPGAPVVTPAMWLEPRDGGSAAERLRQCALSDALAAKRLQVVALQAGLIPAIDFEAFEAGLAAENTRRARALADRQPVYGPQAWNEATLYWERQALLKERLLRAFGAEGLRAKLLAVSKLPVSIAPSALARQGVD